MVEVVPLISILVQTVCWILVLVKMFRAEGALKGILGIICNFYAFIWGWLNVDKHNIKPIMQVWAGAIILGIFFTLILS